MINNINGGAWFGKNADPYSEDQIRKRICDPFNTWSGFFKRKFPLKKQNTLFQDCEMIVKDISRLFTEGKMTNQQLDNLLNSPDLQNEAASSFEKNLFKEDKIIVTKSLVETYPELSNFVNQALPGPNKSMEMISRGWIVEGINETTNQEEKEKIWETSRDLYKITLAEMKEPQLQKLIENLKLSVRTILDSNKDQNSAALSALMSSKWLKDIIEKNFQKNQTAKGDSEYIPCGNSGVADLDCIINEEELSGLLNDAEINKIKEEATIANIPAYNQDNLETALNKWWWIPGSNITELEKNGVENIISNLKAGIIVPYHKDLRLGLKLLVKESKIKKRIMLDEIKTESEEKRKQMRQESREDAKFDAEMKNAPYSTKSRWFGTKVDRAAQQKAQEESNAQEIRLKELELKEQSNNKTTEVINQQTELLKNSIESEIENLKEVLLSKMDARMVRLSQNSPQSAPSYSPPGPPPDPPRWQGPGGGKSRKKKKKKSKSISVKSQTKRKKRTKKRTRRNKKNISSKNRSSKNRSSK